MWMSGGTNTNEQMIDKNWKQQQQSMKNNDPIQKTVSSIFDL